MFTDLFYKIDFKDCFHKIARFFKQSFCHHSYVYKVSLFDFNGYYICTKCGRVNLNPPEKLIHKEN